MPTGSRADASLRRTLPAEALFDVQVRPGALGGRATATMTLPSDGAGRAPSLGWLGVLADVATGRAIMARTPVDVYCQTVSLRLDLGDHPAVFGSSLTGVGEVVAMTDAFALCHVLVHDEGGRTTAAGTARFALTRLDGVDVGDDGPPVGHAGSAADLERLLRLEPAAAPGGRTAYLTLPSADLGNQHGVVHGGVHAGFADVVLSRAVAAASGTTSATLLDLSLTYHRPAPIDGTLLRVEGVVDRLGRRVAVASGTISTESGTLLTSAYGTFALASA